MLPLTTLAVAALAHLVLGASGAVVDAASDVASCPATEQVRAAIARHLGRYGDAMTGWTVRYARNGPDALVVEVRDPAGVVRAVRQVAADRARAAACAVAAETVAAIGVRAFQPVEWNSGERPDAAPAAAAPSPAPRAAPADFQRGRLTVAAGPAFISAPGAGINLGVDIGVGIKGPVAVRIGGPLFPQHRQERAGLAGTASLTRVSTWAGLTWAGQRRAVGFEAGPALAASLDSARTDEISQPSAGRRVALAGGLLAGLGWPVDRRWRVGMVVALLGKLAAADFSVATDGQEAPLLRTPSLTAFAALRVEWTILP